MSSIGRAGSGATFALQPASPDPARPVTRSYFVYDALPGEVIRGEVVVSNVGTDAGTVHLYGVDATTGETGGAVYLMEQDPRRDVGAWIELDRHDLTLGAGQRQTVAFTVTVPVDVRPGEHLGGLVAHNTEIVENPDGSTVYVRLQERAVVAVQVNLPGPVVEQIAITGVSPEIRHGYQWLRLGLRHEGTVMVKPRGTVIVTDGAGQPVRQVSFQLDTILPETAIQYPLLVPGGTFSPGQYHATVELSFGAAGTASYQTTFIVIPDSGTQRQYLPLLVRQRDCRQLLVNGNMESDGGWVFEPGIEPPVFTTERAREGTRSLRAGLLLGSAYTGESWSSAYQAITLPDHLPRVTLGLWWKGEEASQGDRLYISLESENGEVVRRLLATAANGEWRFETYDLSDLRGRHLLLSVSVLNDGHGVGARLYVDDARLLACK